MANIWELSMNVKVDEWSLKKSTKKVQDSFRKTGDTIEKDFTKKTERGAGRIKSAFSWIWWIIAWAFALTSITSFWKKIIWLWSDLEEFWSKFNVVFNWIEWQATQIFDELADNVWRSRLDIKKFWSDLWDVLKPLWFTTEEALKLSKWMTELAIDVASFNNVSDPQVINAFRSALTWEREALKSLGIVISETDVKQEAYNSWITTAWKELTKTQKALATYNLLLKNSEDAQWDAIRTWDSFSNQLKRLQWRLKDVWAELWSKILPLFTKLIELSLSLINKTVEYSKQIWFLIWALWILIWAKGLFGLFTIITKLIPAIRTLTIVQWLLTTSINLSTFSMRAFIIASWPLIWTLALITSALWWATQAYKAYSSALELVDATNKMQESQDRMNQVLDNWVKTRKDNIEELKKQNEELIKSEDKNAKKQIEINNKKIEANQKFLKANYKLFVTWDNAPADNQEKINKLQKEWVALMKEAELQQKKLWKVVVFENEESIKTLNWLNDWLNDMKLRLWELPVESQEFKQLKILIEEAENEINSLWKTTTNTIDSWKKDIDKLNDKYKDWEDAIKEVDKNQEKLKNNIKDYNDEIKESILSIESELLSLWEEYEKTINSIDQEWQNKLAQRYVEVLEEQKWILNEIEEVKKAEELDLEKKLALEKERKALAEEQRLIEEETTEAQREEAQRVAWLNEAELITEEVERKKQAEQEKFESEKERLERLNEINNYFLELEKLNEESLNAFLNEERYKQLTKEEQDLILKLAKEKIKLTAQKEAIIQMQKEIASATIVLSNWVTQIQLNNINQLKDEYSSLIWQINRAIDRQRELNAVKNNNSPWFADWWFTWSGWKNEVAGVVHKWEWVAPKWMVNNMRPIFDWLESKRTKGFADWGYTSNTNKTQNNNITVNSQVDLRAFMDYAKWKL